MNCDLETEVYEVRNCELLLMNEMFGHIHWQWFLTDRSINKNQRSAKACRIRGRSYKELGEYEKARKDLSAAQQMDYDGVAGADLKFVVEKMAELEAETVKKNLEVSSVR